MRTVKITIARWVLRAWFDSPTGFNARYWRDAEPAAGKNTARKMTVRSLWKSVRT